MSEETKWTKGPWHAVIRGGRLDTLVDNTDGPVALVYGEERPANARLIAAAPALYEALEACAADLREQAGVDSLSPESGSRQVYERAMKALALARGSKE